MEESWCNMREIKFRGIKRSPLGDKWVSGYYALFDGEHTIIMPHAISYEKALSENKPIPKVSVNHIVDFNTIGQYTGLKDKNGVEIYEGDIVQQFNVKANGIIEYKYGQFGIKCLNMFWNIHPTKLEVIGNIYDNPELLENK